jgi:hypothetical protein
VIAFDIKRGGGYVLGGIDLLLSQIPPRSSLMVG